VKTLTRPALVRARAQGGQRGEAARVASRAPLLTDAALVLGCAGVTIFALFYNLFVSPDTFYDEVVYTKASQNVALHGDLTWTNVPLFVHPPLMFLVQAAWLLATGHAHVALTSAVRAARLLAATAGAANVLLTASLAYRLARWASRRRRRIITVTVAVVAALDPVLLRYDRQDVLEPFALLVTLVCLNVALWLRGKGRAYVPVVGALSGLALLTNEITIFPIVTPVIFALLERDRALLRRSVTALAVGVVFLFLFLAWGAELGQASTFLNVQSATLQRLVGLVQTTGLNVPGTSLAGSVSRSLAEYLSSYIVLGTGAVALCVGWLRKGTAEARFLTAWLTASYAFGAYIAAAGTFNEQFFVYIMPAAVVGGVLLVDSMLSIVLRLSRATFASVAAGVLALAVIGISGAAWAADYASPGNGVERMDQFIAQHLPACSVVNASGDVEKYSYLLPDRTFSFFSIGPAALADGVHYFVLAPNDAVANYGNMSASLADWIRSHAQLVVSYPSKVYGSVQLWQVPSLPFDAQVGTVAIPGGAFINTSGSRCGGFTVTNSAGSNMYAAFAARGGKAVLGPPLSASFRAGRGGPEQVFQGAVLATSPAGAPGNVGLALPVVAELAARAPRMYEGAGLPRLGASVPVAGRAAWLTDPAIRAAYLAGGKLTGRSFSKGAQLYGLPLGPPAVISGGMVAQAFQGTVLEHSRGSRAVHSVDIAPLLEVSGIVRAPAAAQRLSPDPPLAPAIGLGATKSSTVVPFAITLGGALALFGLITVAVLRFKRDRADGPGGQGAHAEQRGAQHEGIEGATAR